MKTSYNVTCNTKNNKDAVAVESTVTFTWPAAWDEAKRIEVLEQYAIDALTIRWQSGFRTADKDGKYKTIPTVATVEIAEPGRKVSDPDKAYCEIIAKVKGIKPEDVTAEQIVIAKTLMAGSI